jgi:hypothetical protein
MTEHATDAEIIEEEVVEQPEVVELPPNVEQCLLFVWTI